jgi:hypothetical protein
MLENVGAGMPLGRLTNADLRGFGATLPFYDGIPELFADLEGDRRGTHIVKSGCRVLYRQRRLRGNHTRSSIAPHFTGIWGCRFHEEAGQVRHIANSITFTEKTKFLFAINKGISDVQSRSHPFAVNQAVRDEDRRVPFRHMIYIGDGLTDVPCFSLVEKQGGAGFGVFDPRKQNAPKKAWEQLVMPHRVKTMAAPEYGPQQILGSLLRAAVNTICSSIDLRTQTALQSYRP